MTPAARPLLIGERPPPAADLDTHSPLYPLPRGCSGHRLQVVSGLDKSDYLRAFDRMNLVPTPGGGWDRDLACWAATSLLRGCALRDRHVVLLGARVRDAFAGHAPVLLEMEVAVERWLPLAGGCHVALVPHPSGRSRAWNDAGVRERVRRLLSRLAAPWVTMSDGRLPAAESRDSEEVSCASS